MTPHYQSLASADAYTEALGVPAPLFATEREMWPRMTGAFLRRLATDAAPVAAEAAPETVPEGTPDEIPVTAPLQTELVAGQWGLVPPWVKSASDAKLRSPKLVHARVETVSTSKNFYDAWMQGQRCIVPMAAFYADDWRTGKAVATRITRIDGKPMGVAGLWQRWRGADGQEIVSFTQLTLNANNHALMHRYQQPGSEKRMPVILGEGTYAAWLGARPEKAREFLRAYAANWLTANPVQ